MSVWCISHFHAKSCALVRLCSLQHLHTRPGGIYSPQFSQTVQTCIALHSILQHSLQSTLYSCSLQSAVVCRVRWVIWQEQVSTPGCGSYQGSFTVRPAAFLASTSQHPPAPRASYITLLAGWVNWTSLGGRAEMIRLWYNEAVIISGQLSEKSPGAAQRVSASLSLSIRTTLGKKLNFSQRKTVRKKANTWQIYVFWSQPLLSSFLLIWLCSIWSNKC